MLHGSDLCSSEDSLSQELSQRRMRVGVGETCWRGTQPTTDHSTPGDAWVSNMGSKPPMPVPLAVSSITDLEDGTLARTTQSQLAGMVAALTTCTNLICALHVESALGGDGP